MILITLLNGRRRLPQKCTNSISELKLSRDLDFLNRKKFKFCEFARIIIHSNLNFCKIGFPLVPDMDTLIECVGAVKCS